MHVELFSCHCVYDVIARLQVREHPLYHLIKARILKKQGEHDEVAKTLQIAMQLPGVKSKGQKRGR